MATTIGNIVAKLTLNIDNFAANMKRAEESIKQTETKFSGFKDIGNRLSDVGSSMTTHLTLPIVGVGAAATKLWSNFQTGMAKVSTVADQTQVPIKDLGNQVIELSNKTGMSTDDMSQGLYDVLSSGVQTKDAMNYLTVAVKAAKGGFTDTATAVDGLTSTLNAYGLEASKANDIANQMMVAQNLGKTTFGELASVVGNVAPTFAAANVSTKELFSSFAVLTANGIKTSEASTGLKAAISNIIKPSKEATDAAQALGIKFDANTIKSKGWMGTLNDVKAALQKAAPEYAKAVDNHNKLGAAMQSLEKQGKKNTDAYKTLNEQYKASGKQVDALAQANNGTLSGFATMFGSVEGLNTVLTLTSNQGNKLYTESMKEMGDGIDRVDLAYKKMNKTPGSQMQKSLTQLKNAGIAMGDSLAPIMSKLSEAISKVALAIQKLSPQQKDMIAKFALIVAAVGPVISIFGRFMKSVTNITGGIKTFKKIVGAVNLTKLKNDVTGLGTGFSKLSGFIKTGGSHLLNFGKNAGTALVNVGKLTIELGKQAIQWGLVTAKLVAHKIAMTASTIATKIMTAAQAALNFVMGLNPITLIIIAITGLVTAIVLLYNKCEWFRNGVNALFRFLKNVFGDLFTAAKEKFGQIKNVIGENWDAVKKKTSETWNNIKQSTSQTWSNMKQTASTTFSGIHNDLSSTWDRMKSTSQSKGGGLKGTMAALWEGYKGVWRTGFNALNNLTGGKLGNIADKVSSWGPRIKSRLADMFHFQIPHIPLPHFSISGKFSIKPPSVPHLGVNWYDTGGIFNSPSIIGVGEKRPEFVGALDDLKYIVLKALKEAIPAQTLAGATIGGLTIQGDVYVRNDQDIDKLSQSIYKTNSKVLRALGKRDV